jgi:prolyl 4-hydroxylase
MYLTDQVDEHAGDNLQGMKVHRGKGSAVLFYNLLEDGNGDALALHAALPVHRGEKWLGNFWVWDSTRR